MSGGDCVQGSQCCLERTLKSPNLWGCSTGATWLSITYGYTTN
uniref:Uncharacterized protein n=1 Tax=Anguilla anguilla TaxID=7936 RepID=A0A0E9W9F6_ANGAN